MLALRSLLLLAFALLALTAHPAAAGPFNITTVPGVEIQVRLRSSAKVRRSGIPAAAFEVAPPSAAALWTEVMRRRLSRERTDSASSVLAELGTLVEGHLWSTLDSAEEDIDLGIEYTVTSDQLRFTAHQGSPAAHAQLAIADRVTRRIDAILPDDAFDPHRSLAPENSWPVPVRAPWDDASVVTALDLGPFIARLRSADVLEHQEPDRDLMEDILVCLSEFVSPDDWVFSGGALVREHMLGQFLLVAAPQRLVERAEHLASRIAATMGLIVLDGPGRPMDAASAAGEDALILMADLGPVIPVLAWAMSEADTERLFRERPDLDEARSEVAEAIQDLINSDSWANTGGDAGHLQVLGDIFVFSHDARTLSSVAELLAGLARHLGVKIAGLPAATPRKRSFEFRRWPTRFHRIDRERISKAVTALVERIPEGESESGDLPAIYVSEALTIVNGTPDERAFLWRELAMATREADSGLLIRRGPVSTRMP